MINLCSKRVGFFHHKIKVCSFLLIKLYSKPTFELVRIFQPEISNITTTKEEFDGIIEKNMTPKDWMEIQSRS